MRQLLTLLFFVISLMVSAQASIKDSAIFTPLVITSYSYQIPGGNLVNRFGANSNLGLSFLIKTKKNWIFGADGSFLFGNKLKENGILDSISSSGGAIINRNGQFADIRKYERGFTTSLSFGRVFSQWGHSPNSGPLFTGSIGFLQHKIRIEDFNATSPQLSDNYKKGYDRLTNGIAFTEFLGYLFLSNNKIVNFYAGIEFIQALTQSRRSYDFDLMKKDTTHRTDLLFGFRMGWVLPLYKKAPKEFYFY